MHIGMKYVFTFIMLMLSMVLGAQAPSYTVKGIVMDAGSELTIDYATVVIKDKTSGEIVAGTTTEGGGKFSLKSRTSDISLEVSFIGYGTYNIEDLEFENAIAFVGKVPLEADAQALDEVLIRADKSTTEFKLDKRVFNVGADLSSTGAGALEVLNNVPSVNVSIEGDVSLRGSTGVQILINGKPSILSDDASNALGTITADMIDKIEVITNPSAKYEAEGTAGIINIVLKKNEKKGLNGSISLNTGTPHNHSVGLSLNRRSEKFNLFTQLGAGYRSMPRNNENLNIDKRNNSELYSEGTEYRDEKFYNFVLGSDYYIDPLNVITLSGSFTYEVEDQPSETIFQLSEDNIIESEWTRTEETSATNPKYQYELQYRREFEDNKDHQLLFSAIGRFFGKDQSSTFTSSIVRGQFDQNDQLTETSFQEGKYTFNIDYTKPFDEHWTLEVGSQYLINNVSNEFAVSNDIGGTFVEDPNFTNLFEYDQEVLGVYGTGSYEGSMWGVKLGLRVENTDLNTLLVNTGEANDQKFTNLFPSLHTSYKFSEAISFQAGYSRRIYRPRLWDLNPFFNIRNNFSIRTGNPDLMPEYTDSYEVGSIFIWDVLSLNVNAYYRYTTDRIERVFFFQDNVNTMRPENIGTNKASGLEANFKYTVSKKVTLNGDANYNVFQRDGRFSDQVFDFSADQWSGKLTGKYKVRKNVDLEVTGRYQSRVKTVQARVDGYGTLDAGMRIKIMQGKGIFSLSARDIFASRIRRAVIDDVNYFLDSSGMRGRFLTAGFSYGFGKGEAMEFSGRRRR